MVILSSDLCTWRLRDHSEGFAYCFLWTVDVTSPWLSRTICTTKRDYFDVWITKRVALLIGVLFERVYVGSETFCCSTLQGLNCINIDQKLDNCWRWGGGNAGLKMRLLTQLCCGHAHLVSSQSPRKTFLFHKHFSKLRCPLMKLSRLPIFFTVFPRNKYMQQRNEVRGIFFYGATAHLGPRPPRFWSLQITHNETLTQTHPVGLLETSDQPVAETGTYTTHNKHERRRVGFEPAIPIIKRLLRSVATRIDIFRHYTRINCQPLPLCARYATVSCLVCLPLMSAVCRNMDIPR